ncbi:MAG TPA: hypothetical protein VNJ01_10170 [Bacteriovoracaceae bacterium]|nr:hypothetical protein [Bacteriovoracaceae bacterium]
MNNLHYITKQPTPSAPDLKGFATPQIQQHPILVNLDKRMSRTRAIFGKCEKNLQLSRFYRLKAELSSQIQTFHMSESRKSYFIHQLAYVHSFSDLLSLVMVINKLQVMQGSPGPAHTIQDLIYLKFQAGNFTWGIHAFTVKNLDSDCNNFPQ